MLVPVYASSVINVSKHGSARIDFNQVLAYDYLDDEPDAPYYRHLHDNQEAMEEEIRILATNMQEFLDEEKNLVNGERAYPKVHDVSIDFKSRPELVTYTWLIHWEGKEAGDELNVYEAIVEPSVIEYEIKSLYIFPPGTRIEEHTTNISTRRPAPWIIEYLGTAGQRVEAEERIAWKW